ncbi:MAG TPA: MBL fold metallo-hydrolase [Saprospiraceae bacterium]|nr:MBL fold metallo-hydrolase [Saprospiraceae bacterium]
MKVIFLGTGTSQGIPVIGCTCNTCLSDDTKDKRFRTSCMIVIDSVHILIDTSPDLRTQMLNNQITNSDAILFTHEHNDHMAGLDDVRPFNFMQQSHIPAYGEARVVHELKKRFSYIFDEDPYPGAPRINLVEINDIDNFEIKGVQIKPIRVMHGTLPILGFRIGDFAYLTDVKYLPENSYKNLEGVKHLVLNALRYHEHYSHVTVDEAIIIAQSLGVETTYLTHLSHQIVRHDIFEKQLPKGVLPAYDGLVWEL